MADVGVNVSRYLKQFGNKIIFQVLQPMWSRYLNVTDRRTDDMTYCGTTALCLASRGKISTLIDRTLLNKRTKVGAKFSGVTEYLQFRCWVIFTAWCYAGSYSWSLAAWHSLRARPLCLSGLLLRIKPKSVVFYSIYCQIRWNAKFLTVTYKYYTMKLIIHHVKQITCVWIQCESNREFKANK